MTRYTVNLSRARTYSRRKRAQKAMSILREQLETNEGEKVSISPEVNRKIWERGAEKPPSSIEVEVTESAGEKVAVLPESGTETTETEETSESETSDTAEIDYEDLVSGTVSETKDAIKELDGPDYSAALEAEEANKDRKTLKEWLENQQ